MSFKLEEIKSNGFITLRISGLKTLCPHKDMDRIDETELEIKYRPRTDRFIRKEVLMKCLKKLEGKRIPMEIIPL